MSKQTDIDALAFAKLLSEEDDPYLYEIPMQDYTTDENFIAFATRVDDGNWAWSKDDGYNDFLAEILEDPEWTDLRIFNIDTDREVDVGPWTEDIKYEASVLYWDEEPWVE